MKSFQLLNMYYFILLVIFFCIEIVLGQNIFPGSILYASNLEQSWNSPSNNFSLSFIKQSENTYFTAIAFNTIPLWIAGGDPGGAADSSATFRFLSNGDLQLINGSTGSTVWRSNTSGLGITSAALDDSGNLVLSSGSSPIWTTFDNPTDTILPGQNFTTNHILRSGLYSFRLSLTGEISLRWNDSVVYYTSSGINSTTTVSLNLSSPSLSMQPVGIFSVSDNTLSSPVIMARSNDYGEISNDMIKFVKLDSDGNMRIYTSSMSSGRGNMIVRWTAVSDQCRVYGYCGNFGICRYNEADLSPICGCPSENFDQVDPNDGRKGCTRREDIRNCRTTVLALNNSLFLTYPPDLTSDQYTGSITACRSNCLSDTTCLASSSLADGTGVYYMKRSNFVSGYQSPILTSTSFVKVCEPAMPNPPFNSSREKDNNKKMRIAVIVLGGCLGLVSLLVVFLWCDHTRKPGYESLLSQYSVSDYASGVPVQFSHKELQQATRGCTEKLGEGGFGSVYKGVLSNKMVVAVKKLEGLGQGEKQFRMEVVTISSTHHLNLVRLIGFCSEGRHRLLVYEFMKNGSLDKFLFTNSFEDSNDNYRNKSKKGLSWERRYNIALGAAKGITYLHEECRDCILHCDIKPENILLDDNFNARISDFGLARLLNLSDQRQRSLITVRGTRGYLAPEWLANLPITSKADVYSFGMVLIELVSGKRNFEVSTETNGKRFWLWAYEEFEKGNIGNILDKRLMEDDVDMVQAERMIQASFWCIQEQPSRRPVMGKVVQMLEGIGDVHRPPPPPLDMVEGSVQLLPIATVSSSQMAVVSSLASETEAEGSASMLL